MQTFDKFGWQYDASIRNRINQPYILQHRRESQRIFILPTKNQNADESTDSSATF